MDKYRAWFSGVCLPHSIRGTGASGAIVKDKKGTVLLKEGGMVGKDEGMSDIVATYGLVPIFETNS